MFGLLTTLVNFVIGLIELFLGFRFVFRLFGANPAAPFVQWLYVNTDPLLSPFRGIFPTPQLDNGYVIEFTTLVAIFVYMFVGYILLEIVGAIDRVPGRRTRVVEVDREVV